jgi:hypothetical protein
MNELDAEEKRKRRVGGECYWIQRGASIAARGDSNDCTGVV